MPANAKKIGVIGSCAMRLGMATPLRLADHALHACDVKQEAAAGFVAVNGTACNSQADMAASLC